MLFLLANKTSEGAYNLTAPLPVRQGELAKAIGASMKSPAWLPVPGAVLKLFMGQMADEMLLKGASVVPDKLLQAGYQFQSAKLETALRHVIGS